MSEQATTPFTDAGFNDPLMASEFFRVLGVTAEDMKNPNKHAKMAEVASFANMGEEARGLLWRIALKGAPQGFSVLDKVFEYTRLQKDRLSARRQLEEIEKQLGVYE